MLSADAESLFSVEFSQPRTALLLGNEHRGLSETAVELADRRGDDLVGRLANFDLINIRVASGQSNEVIADLEVVLLEGAGAADSRSDWSLLELAEPPADNAFNLFWAGWDRRPPPGRRRRRRAIPVPGCGVSRPR